jgi:hypothetical protein
MIREQIMTFPDRLDSEPDAGGFSFHPLLIPKPSPQNDPVNKSIFYIIGVVVVVVVVLKLIGLW